MRQEEKQSQLHFRFTEKSFLVDEQNEEFTDEILSWKEKFEGDKWKALYDIGFEEKPVWLDVTGRFLYQVADRFQFELTRQPDLELARENIELIPDADTLETLLNSVPFTLGAEYVTSEWLKEAFSHLKMFFAEEISAYNGTVALYLAGKSQNLRTPERIFFHLVESKEDEYPFAFLATYATKDENDKVRHMPLRYALTEYETERGKLLELLSCLNRASEVSPLIGEFVEKGELFHPLRLTSEEAYQILRDVPKIEETGIICRIPNWWKKNACSVSMSVNLGEDRPPMMGLDTILGMVPQLVVDGVPLTKGEIEELLHQTEGLAFLKGKWIEVDHEKLRKLLDEMENYHGDLTLLEALRMDLNENQKQGEDVGAIVTNGTWLADLLKDLRTPKRIRSAIVPKSFRAILRPYQKAGFTWLNYMNKLNFGACLADDMGLGKTVQVLAFLEKLRKTKKRCECTSDCSCFVARKLAEGSRKICS